MNEVAIDWEKRQMADYVREVLPIGSRVVMSKKWTQNTCHPQRPGKVVGYSRNDPRNPIVIHEGRKSRHQYHWSFIIPEKP